jgi:Periplasmic serine proteases (ClpP class)
MQHFEAVIRHGFFFKMAQICIKRKKKNMRVSYMKEILQSVYMIEPSQAIAGKTLLNGLIMGLEFAPEKPNQSVKIGKAENANIPDNKLINISHLYGTMYREDGDCGQLGTQTIADELLDADANPKIIGHILHIDSGGGAANSVPVLAKAIQQCTKPVVAFVDGMMASAAMYAGSYCDKIIANDKLDRIGCIGTMVQLADYPKKNVDQDGFVRLRIYADGSEEKTKSTNKP